MTNTTTKPTESFADLFAESLAKQEMKQGEVIPAEVVRVDYNYVVVNAGLKSESFIPIEEFKNDRGEVDVKVGDFVSVAIESLENGYGDTVLSRDKAKRLAAWMNLEKALETGELVTGTVTGKVKGGLTVMTNGIRAFLPGSLVDTRPVKDTTPYEGKTMEFKVIKLDRKRNNVVLSRRAVVEASMGEERAKLLETLKEGAIVKGIVKNITDYGAFVDLGGIDGLLHITDLAWRRVRHPSEVLEQGQEITAKVLKFDQEKNRVSLGIKQLGEDPWIGIARRYPQATTGGKKSTVWIIASSSLILYTAASSDVSGPTRSIGSVNFGSLPTTCARTFGPILAPHPAALASCVRRTSLFFISFPISQFTPIDLHIQNLLVTVQYFRYCKRSEQ